MTKPNSNPIAQLKALKAQMQAQKRTESTFKPKGKANTKASVKTAQNGGKAFLSLAQLSRTFDLANANIETCKANFPDCYHFKKQLAKECEFVVDALHNGALLLAQLVQLSGYQTLTDEQKAVLKQFNQVKGYLTGNLRTTAKHVTAVEDGTATKCYSDRFKPQGAK